MPKTKNIKANKNLPATAAIALNKSARSPSAYTASIILNHL